MRGWTRWIDTRRRHLRVSPALAGMDPAPEWSRRGRIGFPRACGDGPTDIMARRRAKRFPPRLRGWTLLPGALVRMQDVSPALAGMDPYGPAESTHSSSFPRACGDGPDVCSIEVRRVQFPPRLRGWTLRFGSLSHHWPVSPALAGMDPSRWLRDFLLECFPRACGDGPASAVERSGGRLFPPRLRGWTPEGRAARRRDLVSPALAGMDPMTEKAESWSKRFPRACGDGPVSCVPAGAYHVFPPRLRGWTLRRRRRDPAGVVSPALAGMDPFYTRTRLET